MWKGSAWKQGAITDDPKECKARRGGKSLTGIAQAPVIWKSLERWYLLIELHTWDMLLADLDGADLFIPVSQVVARLPFESYW